MTEAEDPTLRLWERGLRVILMSALDIENDTNLAEEIIAEEIAACTPRDTGDAERAVHLGTQLLFRAVNTVSTQLVEGLRELTDQLLPEQAPASIEQVVGGVWNQVKQNRELIQINRSLDQVLEDVEGDGGS